ncbi:hypothetical protein [Pedobacter nutrimenti]|uniref:hypothetical protein n=1 Tax=Pedobacter nutrimenti TaxID=1241337 RepID=UPI0018EE10FB|nr:MULTISPECIES: hypothetical protein [Pedobacter]
MARLFVYTKDVQVLTGRGEKIARRLLGEIRKKYCKSRCQLVTIVEFCEYMDLKLDLVLEQLK